VTVDGPNSTFATKDVLYVGNAGTGELHIKNGGQVTNAYGALGYDPGSRGTVTVDGKNSTWTNTNDLYVGLDGTGHLAITNNGQVNVAGYYVQDRNSSLTMDIGSLGSGKLTVGNTVILDGDLFLTTNGPLNALYYTLIDNLGRDPIDGTFTSIFLNGEPLTLTTIDNTGGGGSFTFDGTTYYFSYTGQSSTGSIFGGNDLLIRNAIPEPASLAILGLGIATMMRKIRRQK